MSGRILYTTTLVLLALITLSGQEPDSTGVYVAKVFEGDGRSINYRIMYPRNFPSDAPYPLVVFMHGAGERGDDNKSQLVHGSVLFRDSLSQYPSVVLFPQCPADGYWAQVERNPETNRISGYIPHSDPSASMAMAMQLIKSAMSEDYIDKSRIYAAGISMGSMATWELLWRMPGTFAAAMPICGGGAPQMADRMTDVPIWSFHGKLDDVVMPQHSIRMVKAVQQAGGKAKITIYTNANHNSWDSALAEPGFLKWMFSKSR